MLGLEDVQHFLFGFKGCVSLSLKYLNFNIVET